MTAKSPMSILLYHRLTSYLHYLKSLPESGPDNVSSTVIAAALGANDVQVRKDLAVVSNGGKPKIGYITKALIADLAHYLGHDNCTDAVLAGAGNLGKALLSYENFEQYGLKIVAAFDANPALVGTEQSGVKILDAAKITDMCRRMNIRVGILAVPAFEAQAVCDALVAGGVRAIWNFAPANLRTPAGVIVKNEDMAASLAVLTRQLVENQSGYEL
ncbi:MAG: redox-sensing transcriptional repressor Rex [Oscillospiraceae bacterium]|jgi:redox-sensing transcriptional repressor|nr:redox-sensing transcriptional repressor Rex [Oscillospiraceae bacterium]